MKSNKPIILASASPRRKELLAGLGYDFEVIPSLVHEVYPDSIPLTKVPEYLAELKGSLLASQYPDSIIVSADTVVILDGEILGKPLDANDAYDMLKRLSGNKHEVITGVYIAHNTEKHVFSDTSEVYFRKLSEEEIRYYVEHYQPFDKAGSYGVQEWIGYVAVDKIVGSFYNVMGLPISHVYAILKEM